MRFVIASLAEAKVARASELLAGSVDLDFRYGLVPDVSAGCDAEIVHFTVAHDRYGGKPQVGQSQVLRNSRNDGAPPLIIATPPLEAGAGMGPDRDSETKRHSERMIGMALEAWASSPSFSGDSSALCCLIHIEAAGLDFGSIDAIIGGIGNAIRPYVGHAQ
jgi:hypothetical protein